MKRIYFSLLIPFLLPLQMTAQVSDSLTLDDCHRSALSQYPLSSQFALLEEKNETELKKLNTHYLPQVNIGGQASYQSDVTKVDVIFDPIYLPPPIDMELATPSPTVPFPPKDQYRINLNLDQVIYDGGITAGQKEVENANYKIEKQNVEIELYKVKEQVNRLFFSITLLQENEKLLKILQDQINEKLKDVASAVRHGIALESDRDVLTAELIRIDQQLTEVKINREAAITMLEELTCLDIGPDTYLVLPDPEIDLDQYSNERPEYDLFEMYRMRNEAAMKLADAQWMPKLAGYGQLGYGQPGLNMMDPAWDTYYIFGARLQWKIWNWNKYKREKEVLELQDQIISTRQASFDKNTRVATARDIAEIKKYQYLVSKDMEIIALRKRIAETASSQLDNGVITSTDYIQRVNDATQAEINMKTHEIQLIQAKVNYNFTLGKL